MHNVSALFQLPGASESWYLLEQNVQLHEEVRAREAIKSHHREDIERLQRELESIQEQVRAAKEGFVQASEDNCNLFRWDNSWPVLLTLAVCRTLCNLCSITSRRTGVVHYLPVTWPETLNRTLQRQPAVQNLSWRQMRA